MSIDFKQVYRDRIIQIDKDRRQAVLKKNWTELAKLDAEKENLKKRLK